MNECILFILIIHYTSIISTNGICIGPTLQYSYIISKKGTLMAICFRENILQLYIYELR